MIDQIIDGEDSDGSIGAEEMGDQEVDEEFFDMTLP